MIPKIMGKTITETENYGEFKRTLAKKIFPKICMKIFILALDGENFAFKPVTDTCLKSWL